MKIIQLLPTLAYGDAIGNDAMAIHRLLTENGYETIIYAENIDARIPEGICKPVLELEQNMALIKEIIKDDDVILYHMSTGTRLNEFVTRLPGKKGMIYHNVTPGHFYHGYNTRLEKLCNDGRIALQYLADEFDFAFADSEYNAKELRDLHYTCDVDVLPIIIAFDDYKKTPDEETIKKYSDGKTNVIFTGRLAPNKKQEDVIKAFNEYQKHYNANSRLILVGSYNGTEKYYEELKDYAKELGVKDVVFTGHISFEAMLACYKVADVFLCMSEHEGFCVPLVEAMYFDVPIIAYDSSAIGYTLGGSGVLLKDKNAVEVAGVMDRIVNSKNEKINNTEKIALYESILQGQRQKLEFYSNDHVSDILLEKMKRL